MNAHRPACPEPDLLLALDEGVLSESLSEEVRAHVSACRICARMRQDLRESAFAEPTLANLERVRRRIFGSRVARAARRLRYAGAIAAAAVLVAGIFFSRPVRPPVAQEAPPARPVYRLELAVAPLRLPFATAMVLRGKQQTGAEAYLKELGRALEPYRAGRYTEAVAALAALRQNYRDAVEPPFYEGVARLLAGDTARALSPLRRAREIDGEALHDDILWYLAIGSERNGQRAAAEAALRELCSVEGEHRQAACAGLAAR